MRTETVVIIEFDGDALPSRAARQPCMGNAPLRENLLPCYLLAVVIRRPPDQREVLRLDIGQAEMITYGWGRGLATRPDVSALRAKAAAFDAEQGFVPLSPQGPVAGQDVWELVVQARRHAKNAGRQGILSSAAYLRVNADGDAEFVVHPEFRSVGVATSLTEKLGAESAKSPAEGPEIGRFRIWAYGSHPAADRMAKRFGLVPDRVEAELVVPTSSARAHRTGNSPLTISAVDQRQHRAYLEANTGVGHDGPADAIRLAALDANGGAVAILVARPGGRGDNEATIEFLHVGEGYRRRGIARALLERVLLELADSEVRLTRLVVGEREDLIPMLRSLGWRHDQTNLRFTVGPGVLSARPHQEGTTP